MTYIERWNVILQQHKYPCFLADADTTEIFYVNEALATLMGGSENLIGKVYYHAIVNDLATITGDGAPDWSELTYHEQEIYNQSLGRAFRVTLTVLKELEKPLIFCSLTPSENDDRNDFSFEQTMTRCIAALQLDAEQKTQELLGILGNFYEADKTYLYLFDSAKNEIICKNSWVAREDLEVTTHLSQKIDIEVVMSWLDSRNEVGIVDTSKEFIDVSEGSLGGQVLNAFAIDNVVLAVVEDHNHHPLGMITIANRRNRSADFRLLQSIAHFMERDITQNEEKISIDTLNEKDILTGFLNRSAYAKHVEEINSNPPKSLGVFFANVNGLKKINADYGYAKGDGFIKRASEVMNEHFNTTIYRISGDEFVAFFPDIEKDEFESLTLALREKQREGEENLFALGHAWGTGRYQCNDLIRESDVIMYINKQEYYHQSNRRFDEISDSTLSDLLSYLDDGEFMIYLQPQVRLKDGSLYGAEALIRRFDKKNQKMVFPDQFISLYEQKSVIRHVDIFVVNEVCKLLAQWHNDGKDIPVSVNLSRVTLQEYGIVDTIVKICDKYQVPHELLVIEVTERVGLIENNVASALIAAFKENGFNISLDDFGCAYSNIVTLAQIRVDEVKIDKSLVDNLTTNSQNHILVKNVLTMCNELDGASTLAEGIEDEQQARLLHELGCHLGQGYFYSRPIPVEDFIQNYVDGKEVGK
ncbi:MAG: bifunctional diguanylate cyclase/phosphodiesterase [Eubacteriales bacterium]